MTTDGPQLEPLLHRLAECPAEFLDVATTKKSAGIDVIAIVCDLLRAFSTAGYPELQTDKLSIIRGRAPRELAILAVICWLLHDEWFLTRPELGEPLWKLLTSEKWAPLAALVRAENFISDADRREELVRLCLAHLDLRPQGETEDQAADRLTTLDSAERDRVLRETAAAERRAREIREAMARQKALESTSRYGE